jgi:hypothetical protein
MINTIEKIYSEGHWSSYKMTLTSGKIWSVPLDETNSDYQAIQEWIAEGNTV